jgi:hypothetical protein
MGLTHKINYGLTCHSVPSAESVPSECLSSEGNEVCSSQVKVPENNILLLNSEFKNIPHTQSSTEDKSLFLVINWKYKLIKVNK